MVAIYSTMTNANDGDNDDIDKVQSEAPDFIKKYEIKASIGKGLSSTVYVCVDKNSGKEYAVKVMDVSEDHINADGQNIVQQIHQEIRLLRLVEGHQFIIELVEVFESSAFIFLVFELCQNNDLFEYLSANVSLSEKRCRAIMKQIFEAVYHCHKVKVSQWGKNLKNYPKIHILKVSFLAKFTISKSHFSQNSHFLTFFSNTKF